MAPITATSIGLARQTIDDAELTSLLRRLRALVESDGKEGQSEHGMEEMIDGLAGELKGLSKWRFQEQVSEN